MLISGFVDGKLIYILEFPFAYSEFIKHLEEQLQHRFGNEKRTARQFLRSANFDYKYFIDCPNLKIIYLLSKDKLEKYKLYIVRDFYKFLEDKTK